MKKVILLGDSIRQIGYGSRVQGYLGDEYTVWQPEDNCRFARYTQRMLFDYREYINGADVVHWNNGHWDYCVLDDEGSFTPIEEYRDTMLRIARQLKKMSKRVIFATTTPVLDNNPHNSNETLQKYNEILIPEFEKMGVEINDMFGLIYPEKEKYIRADDMIHLNEEGIELCAKEVADFIKNK